MSQAGKLPLPSASPAPARRPSGARPQWRAGSELPDRGEAPPPQLARRITAIHMPRFAMERWQRALARRGDAPPEDIPQALATEGPHGPVIHATNRAAEEAGITAGARVVDMRALCPELRVDYADLAGDDAALDRLVLWARRWCPWTAADLSAPAPAAGGAAGLVMDTTGSDHLMGGEAAMLRAMEEQLSTLGISASPATAPTHGAAWALARYAPPRGLCPPEALAQIVAPLPVSALRLAPQTVLLLQRLGLGRIGDLATVPRISLARRFSRAPLAENPLLRLDQIMGRLAEPVSAGEDPPRFAVQSRLAEPVQDPTAWLPELCRELCGGLAAAGFGARRVTMSVFRTDGEVSSVSAVTARASRDPDHLCRLFEGRLERIDPGFGFDLITLAAPVVEDLRTIQTRLDRREDDGAELARLIDRLAARLGPGALRRPDPAPSHIPERAEAWAAAMGHPKPATGPTPAAPRPLRLLYPPEELRVLYAVPEGPPAQFVWRRLTHRVARFAGPERIAPEWWRDHPGARLRDYYRVEDQSGRRFWIFREGILGDGRGHEPAWFLHGVFG
jgi:protein ImuB